MKTRKRNKLVFGVGINDHTRPVYNLGGDGKLVACPYHLKWFCMLRRCYDTKHLEKYTTYKGCTVCEEWKYLSNFIKWVDSQPNRDWQNCELDKDLLVEGNKVYSPNTCVFVSKRVNNFINIDIGNTLGYSCSKNANTYEVKCRDPLKRNKEYIGCFNSPEKASIAYWTVKRSYCLDLAELETDFYIRSALLAIADKIFKIKLAI